MNKILYKIPFAIFILNVIYVILTYFWIDSINFTFIIFSFFTIISFGMFVKDIKNIDLYDAVFVNGNGYINAIIFICIIYAFVNFIVCIALLSDGSPYIIDGTYYKINKIPSNFIREEISKKEYYKLLLVEKRLSGSAIVFSALPLVTCFRKLKLINKD